LYPALNAKIKAKVGYLINIWYNSKCPPSSLRIYNTIKVSLIQYFFKGETMKTIIALLLFVVSFTSYSGDIWFIYHEIELGTSWYTLNNGATIYTYGAGADASVDYNYSLSSYPFIGLSRVKVWKDGVQQNDNTSPLNGSAGSHTYRVELWERYISGGEFCTSSEEITFTIVQSFHITVKNNFSGGAVIMDGTNWPFQDMPWYNPWYGSYTLDYIIRTWGQNTTHSLTGIDDQVVNGLSRKWNKWSVGVNDFSDISVSHTVTQELTSQANYWTQPTAPTGPSVTSYGISYNPKVQWNRNSESDVTCYKVYRNNSEIATVSQTSVGVNPYYVDESVTWNGVNAGDLQYSYYVKAQNSYSMLSAASTVITITTWGEIQGKGGIAVQSVPQKHSISNYPNPFNPTTTIVYQVPEASHVNVTVSDYLGREISTLANEFKNAGIYKVQFNASKLASGIYYYRMHSGNFTKVERMILQK
jgi:hypothetical protein